MNVRGEPGLLASGRLTWGSPPPGPPWTEIHPTSWPRNVRLPRVRPSSGCPFKHRPVPVRSRQIHPAEVHVLQSHFGKVSVRERRRDRGIGDPLFIPCSHSRREELLKVHRTGGTWAGQRFFAWRSIGPYQRISPPASDRRPARDPFPPLRRECWGVRRVPRSNRRVRQRRGAFR